MQIHVNSSYIHKTVFDYIYLKITHQIKERETTVNLLIFNFSLQNSTFLNFICNITKESYLTSCLKQ